MHNDVERILPQMLLGHDVSTIIEQVLFSGKCPVYRHFELNMATTLLPWSWSVKTFFLKYDYVIYHFVENLI